MDSSIIRENSVEELLAVLRTQDPTQYYTLIKMHLSFATDLPTDQCDGSFDNSSVASKWNLSPMMRKLIRNNPPTQPSNRLLSLNVVHQLFKLIGFLNTDENIKQEGLFRKAGSMTRQTELKSALQNGKSLDLNSGLYTAHDCASVLKSFLADLPEPLLQESQYHVHCKIAEMCGKYMTVDEKSLVHTRQIRALRLIFLLLPSVNYDILRELLLLLHRVTSYQELNKMTSLNLGTMFAPHILCPRKMSPSDLQYLSGSLSTAIAFIIDNAPSLFEVPQELEIDIREYFRNQKNLDRQLSKSSLEEAPTRTSFTFLDRELTAQANEKDVTELALAELYAYVQSLPNSARKRKLISQFNEASGQGTPKCSQNSHKRPDFKVKSFGDSIKKHLFTKSLKKLKNKGSMVKGLNIKRSNSEDILRTSSVSSPEFDTCKNTTESKAKSLDNLLSPKTLLVSCNDIPDDIGQSPHLMGDRNDAIYSSSSECTTPVLSNDNAAETPELRFAFTEKCEEVRDSSYFDHPQFPTENEINQITCKSESKTLTESISCDERNQIRASDSVCITNIPLTLPKEELDNSSPISRAIKGINNDQQTEIMTPRSRCPLIITSTTSLSSTTLPEEMATSEESQNTIAYDTPSSSKDFTAHEILPRCEIFSRIDEDSSESVRDNQPQSELCTFRRKASILGGFFKHLSTSSLLKLASKLQSCANTDNSYTKSCSNIRNDEDESLSNVFTDYLLNRNIIIENPDDSSDSSDKHWLHKSEEINKNLSSDETCKSICNNDLIFLPRSIDELISSPQQLSDSLLYCLDGNSPKKNTSLSKRSSSSSDDNDSNHKQANSPKKQKSCEIEHSECKLKICAFESEVFQTNEKNEEVIPIAQLNEVKFTGVDLVLSSDHKISTGSGCSSSQIERADDDLSNVLKVSSSKRLYTCSPNGRRMSLLKNPNGTPVPNRDKENSLNYSPDIANVLFETDL